MKLYIAVLDEFPDYMTPTLVAHAVLGAHLHFNRPDDFPPKWFLNYREWLDTSFKKCVVRVNQREFDKIAALPGIYLAHEKTTLDGRDSCVVVCPMPTEELPNVLRFAKLWKPNHE